MSLVKHFRKHEDQVTDCFKSKGFPASLRGWISLLLAHTTCIECPCALWFWETTPTIWQFPFLILSVLMVSEYFEFFIFYTFERFPAEATNSILAWCAKCLATIQSWQLLNRCVLHIWKQRLCDVSFTIDELKEIKSF